MQRLNFSIEIKAPKEKVWAALWEEDNYREWTSTFSEGSHAISDWKEGSKILFLGPTGEGMFSTIEKLTTYEFMSFKHLGVVKDGIEQELDEATKEWNGCMENYTLQSVDDHTKLFVDIDVTNDFVDYFSNAFPKALEKVKEIAER